MTSFRISEKQITDIVLCFSGIIQSYILYSLLNSKMHAVVELQEFKSVFSTLFVNTSDTVVNVYGDVKNLALGLSAFDKILNKKLHKDKNLSRYIFCVIGMGRKFIKDKNLQYELERKMKFIEASYHYSKSINDDILLQISKIYNSMFADSMYGVCVSQLFNLLHDREKCSFIADVLIMTGIRSGILWEQIGGKKYQFLIYKKSIKKAVSKLLSM